MSTEWRMVWVSMSACLAYKQQCTLYAGSATATLSCALPCDTPSTKTMSPCSPCASSANTDSEAAYVLLIKRTRRRMDCGSATAALLRTTPPTLHVKAMPARLENWLPARSSHRTEQRQQATFLVKSGEGKNLEGVVEVEVLGARHHVQARNLLNHHVTADLVLALWSE